MRRHEQLSLTQPWIDHSHARELEAISRMLDEEADMVRLIEQDLVQGVKSPHTGARGMSGDQVLRVLVVKQMNGFSYEELHFHLLDSASYRTFCRFGALEEVPAKSTLAENVKKVRVVGPHRGVIVSYFAAHHQFGQGAFQVHHPRSADRKIVPERIWGQCSGYRVVLPSTDDQRGTPCRCPTASGTGHRARDGCVR